MRMKMTSGIALLAVLSTFAFLGRAHAAQEDVDLDATLYNTHLEARAAAQKKVDRIQALLAEQHQVVSDLSSQSGKDAELANAKSREADLQGSLDQWRIELAGDEQELVTIRQRCPSCDITRVSDSPLQATKTIEQPAAREPAHESQGRFRSLSNPAN